MKSSLFLGVPLDEDLRAALDALNEHQAALFLGAEGSLQKIDRNGENFLAKELGSLIDYESLILNEKHVQSLLLRLNPALQGASLLLFSHIND